MTDLSTEPAQEPRFRGGPAFSLWILYPVEMEDLEWEGSWVERKLEEIEPELVADSEVVIEELDADWRSLRPKMEAALREALGDSRKFHIRRSRSRREIEFSSSNQWSFGMTLGCYGSRFAIRTWVWIAGGAAAAERNHASLSGKSLEAHTSQDMAQGVIVLGDDIPLVAHEIGPVDLDAPIERAIERLARLRDWEPLLPA